MHVQIVGQQLPRLFAAVLFRGRARTGIRAGITGADQRHIGERALIRRRTRGRGVERQRRCYSLWRRAPPAAVGIVQGRVEGRTGGHLGGPREAVGVVQRQTGRLQDVLVDSATGVSAALGLLLVSLGRRPDDDDGHGRVLQAVLGHGPGQQALQTAERAAAGADDEDDGFVYVYLPTDRC